MKARYLMPLALLLTACGGGGGGDDDGVGEFNGVWNGNASLVEDNCSTFPSEYSIFFTHLVNQDGATIVLDNGASVFQGTAGEQSFNASLKRAGAEPFPGAGTCEETITWRYDAVERDTANFVVRTSMLRCTAGTTVTECSRTFSGSAYRSPTGNGVFPNPPIPIEPGIGDGSTLDDLDSGEAQGPVSDTDI